MPPPYKVVFVRHGESEWNKLNLFCGWQDVNLSEAGDCVDFFHLNDKK